MKLEHLYVQKITITSKVGVHVREAIVEAIKLSVHENTTVELIHNDKNYIIPGNEIVDEIYKQNNK